MHYAIIDREEFIALYKFGEIPLTISRVISPRKKGEAKTMLLSKLKEFPIFEYEEDFLIIQLVKPFLDSHVEIGSVRELIPLSERAKISYERKFDPRLIFSPPHFESILEEYFEYTQLRDHTKGAKSLTGMFELHSDFSTFQLDQCFFMAYKKKILGERSHSFEDDFFTHLFLYDRYEFFPRTDLGYLYDIGTILANSKGRKDFFGSRLHSFLEGNKDQLEKLKLSQIFNMIEESTDLDGFRLSLTREDIRLYVSAALFLKFKEECREAETIFETSIVAIIRSSIRNHELMREFELAVYLTGMFFGFQKFNHDYYEAVSLPIIRERSVSEAFHRKNEQNEEKQMESEWMPAKDMTKLKDDDEHHERTDDSIKNKTESKTLGELQGHEKMDMNHGEEQTISRDLPLAEGEGEMSTNVMGKEEEDSHSKINTANGIEGKEITFRSELTVEEESNIIEIEKIFSREGKSVLKVSILREHMGFSKNDNIINLVKSDPKSRFSITKIGRSDALTRTEPKLFSDPS